MFIGKQGWQWHLGTRPIMGTQKFLVLARQDIYPWQAFLIFIGNIKY